MSGDLVSIRLLCVGAVQQGDDLWRLGAGRASVPVDFEAGTSAAGAARLAAGGVDICVVDGNLPPPELARVLKAARASEPAPFVVGLAASDGKRIDGIDGMLMRPGNPDEARKAVELCVRVKFPTRVLVVDDSNTMRSIVRKILAASRFALDVHEASEGMAAVNMLRGGNFGMVFLDYNMPGQNGFETLSQIKRENPDVAVVMMTSTLDNALAERAHAAGALAFLKKPFYPADIDAVLERYFGLNVARP